MYTQQDDLQDYDAVGAPDVSASTFHTEEDENRRSDRTRDVHQEITDQIASALEAGVVPWVQPWSTPNAMPRNGVTGRHYSGINVLLLWLTTMKRGYRSPDWYTFNQACEAVGLKPDDRGRWIFEAGKGIRKGARGTRITFWRTITVRDSSETATDGESAQKDIPFLRAYTVFNRDQIDGLPAAALPVACTEHERLSQVDRFIARTNATVHEDDTATAPVYFPGRDDIAMPPLSCFNTVENFYAALLHELTHWTGHVSRLDRDLSGGFGSPAYAAEELVAELGAAFLCADLQIVGRLQHPEYLAHWVRHLRNDNRAIFRASALARQAAEYLHRLGDSTTGTEPQ